MRIFKSMIIFMTLLSSVVAAAQIQMTKTVSLMGSVFQITVVDQDTLVTEDKIHKAVEEIERIENLISEWRPQTQISQVNRNAGITPVRVDREVFELTKRALWFSDITNGAFDISIVAMDNIWKFDGSMKRLPSKRKLKKSVAKVNYKHVVLDSINTTIYLKRHGMKIGFGATGKGYAADKARELLQSLGVKGGLINAAGDISAWGKQLDGEPWRIGVKNPLETGEIITVFEFASEKSITTSGNYEKFVELDGKRYSHIINPKTGMSSSEIISVTIMGDNAEFCNGFSTSIMVLGVNESLALLKNFPNLQYVIVTNEGRILKNFE